MVCMSKKTPTKTAKSVVTGSTAATSALSTMTKRRRRASLTSTKDARVSSDENTESRVSAPDLFQAPAETFDQSELHAAMEHLQHAIRPVLAISMPDLSGLIPADTVAAIADVGRLLSASIDDPENKKTSLRVNRSLWEAADVAVRHGWALSLTDLVEQSLAARLVGITSSATEQAALDEHYARHPKARSDLWEVAVAAAQIDGNPLSDHPDLIRKAADALGDQADIDSVLVWAAGALAGSTR